MTLQQLPQNTVRVIRTYSLLQNLGCRFWAAGKRRNPPNINVFAKTMMMQSATYRYMHFLLFAFWLQHQQCRLVEATMIVDLFSQSVSTLTRADIYSQRKGGHCTQHQQYKLVEATMIVDLFSQNVSTLTRTDIYRQRKEGQVHTPHSISNSNLERSPQLLTRCHKMCLDSLRQTCIGTERKDSCTLCAASAIQTCRSDHNCGLILTHIQHLFHSCVTSLACKRFWSFCEKCRWQITSKHAYTLDQAKLE